MMASDLAGIMPYAADRAAKFIGPLLVAMTEFGITTPKRQAAFLAQIAHESGELRFTCELADGKAYEGRADLGNTTPGDGPRYKGRGLIQLTGKANYQKFQDDTGMSVVAFPEILEDAAGACRVAGWFWKNHGCNPLADADKFGALTKVINGGYNGLDARIGYWLKARAALRVS